MQSHAPSGVTLSEDSTQFWLGDQLEHALEVLIQYGKYSGRMILESGTSDQNNEGLICVKELMSSNLMVLRNHIARMPSYTEKHCRHFCRQMAKIIKMAHDNGLAHRNIHLNNWFVDQKVRSGSVSSLSSALCSLSHSPLFIFQSLSF